MVDVIGIFLLSLLGIIFYIIGRLHRSYIWGVLGGMIIFLLGIAIVNSPIDGVNSFINLIMLSAFIGVGGYVWIRGSLETLDEKGYLS